MKASDKINYIKHVIGEDTSTFIRQYLRNFDYSDALTTALRLIAAESRIIEKTLFIPVTSDYGALLDVLKLTKDKLEYHKILVMNLVKFDGSTLALSFADVKIESIGEGLSGQWLYSDLQPVYKSCLRYMNNTPNIVSSFNSNHTLGTFASASDVSGLNFGLTPALTYDPDKHKFAFDLEGSPLSPFHPLVGQITGFASSRFTTTNLFKWNPVNTNKIYVANEIPTFLSLLCQCIPTYEYISIDPDLPLTGDFDIYVNYLMINYLFTLLINRKPETVKLYDAMLKTGLTKSDDVVQKLIKRKVTASKNADMTVKAYQPFSND